MSIRDEVLSANGAYASSFGARSELALPPARLARSLETAELVADGFRDVGTGPGSPEANYIDWLTIANKEQSVVDDVQRIRSHPLVPATIPIYGYLYDVSTGHLIDVPGATAV